MNKKKIYTFEGKEVVPLTLEVAKSLDRGDTLKYIGSPSTQYPSIFYKWARRPFVLERKPSLEKISITIKYGYRGSMATTPCLVEELALLKRGELHRREMTQAVRWIPHHLKRFKGRIGKTILDTQASIDSYLNALPLHKKLELFKKLSPEEKIVYDCLYKDIEALIGLREEKPDGT